MTHALLKSLRSNPYMRAVPADEVPRTRPVNKWTGFKKLPAPKIPTPCPTPSRRRAPGISRDERYRLARLVETFERETRGQGKDGRRTQGALKSSGVEIFKELIFAWLNLKSGALFPAHHTIAAATGWSVSTVKRALKALASAGILHWIRRSIVRNGQRLRTSNSYQLGQRGPGTTQVKILNGFDNAPSHRPELVLILRDVASRVGCNLLS